MGDRRLGGDAKDAVDGGRRAEGGENISTGTSGEESAGGSINAGVTALALRSAAPPACVICRTWFGAWAQHPLWDAAGGGYRLCA
jgi:hypothetical protein